MILIGAVRTIYFSPIVFLFAPAFAIALELTTSLPFEAAQKEQSNKKQNIIEVQNWQEVNKTSVTKVLSQQPMVQEQGRGPDGQAHFVSINGGSTSHTLVTLDDFELNDPSAPDGVGDLSWLDTASLKTIEIHSGPRSGKYGSSAMGGVLSLKSKDKLNSAYSSQMSLRVASYDTREISVFGISGKNESNVSAIHFFQSESDGYSVAGSGDGNSLEADGSFKQNIFVRLKNRIGRTWVKTSFIGNRTFLDLDQGGGREGDDPNFKLEQDLYMLGSSAHLRVAEIEHKFAVQGSLFRREYIDQVDENHNFDVSNEYTGQRLKAEYSTSWNSKGTSLMLGAGTVSEALRMKFVTEEIRDYSGFGFLQGTHSLSDVELSYAIRLDQQERESATLHNSYRVGVEYSLDDSSNVFVENSTGYKVPSLSQVHDPNYGNRHLKSEKVFRNAMGVSSKLYQFELSGEYFEQTYDDLIAWDFARMRSENLNKAQINGVNGTLAYKPAPSTKVSLSASRFFRKTDVTNDVELLNRPDWRASLSFWQELSNGIRLQVSQMQVGPYLDSEYSFPYNRHKNPGYSLTNAGVGYSFDDEIEVHVSVENLFDLDYQKISGYQTDRRSYSAVFKASF